MVEGQTRALHFLEASTSLRKIASCNTSSGINFSVPIQMMEGSEDTHESLLIHNVKANSLSYYPSSHQLDKPTCCKRSKNPPLTYETSRARSNKS